MRKSFTKIVLVNLLITLVIAAFDYFQGHRIKSAMFSGGVTLLVLAIINFVLAIIIAIVNTVGKKENDYVGSFMLFAALALLCSFTLCSSGFQLN